MASTQVLNSSASSFSYTNTTGKNVRLILSYVQCIAAAAGTYNLNISVGGVNICSSVIENGGGRLGFGKNASAGAYNGGPSGYVAFSYYKGGVENNGDLSPVQAFAFTAPHELYVANGQTATITTDVGFVTIKVNAMAVTES